MRLFAPLDRRAPPRRPARRNVFAPGAALLGLATLVTAGTFGLVFAAGQAIYCDRLAPLGVLAVLAAVLVALAFRALAAAPATPRLVVVALLLSCLSLFAAVRFIARYRVACGQVEQQLQQLRHSR